MPRVKKHIDIFTSLLRTAALLPKADEAISKQYSLSRKQIYLIYLVDKLQKSKNIKVNLQVYSDLLNISSSTLTRNIEKLESRKLLERVKFQGERGTRLRLLSLGQLYSIEINHFIEEYFKKLEKSHLGQIEKIVEVWK